MFGNLKRNSYKRYIFLLPVRIDDEILPEDRIKMLCCNEKADLVTMTVSKSTFEIIRSYVRELEKGNKRYAMLGIEVSPGYYVPFPVYIDSEHLMCLENIVEHAVRRKVIPWVLRKYVKNIISMGNIRSDELIKNYVLRDQIGSSLSSQSLMHSIRASRDNNFNDSLIPTYKAQHNYPAIILKKMDPDGYSDTESQRVLILDSDGDLAISKVPAQPLESEEGKCNLTGDGLFGCITYKHEKGSYIFDHIILNSLQQKSLEIILEQYEKTGSGERPLPLFAEEVLSRARTIFEKDIH